METTSQIGTIGLETNMKQSKEEQVCINDDSPENDKPDGSASLKRPHDSVDTGEGLTPDNNNTQAKRSKNDQNTLIELPDSPDEKMKPDNSRSKDNVPDSEKKQSNRKQDDSPVSRSTRSSVSSSAIVTRSRRSGVAAAEDSSKDNASSVPSESGEPAEESGNVARIQGRWRVHQMAEDYVSLVGEMMYPRTQLRPYGFDSEKREYPLEGISVLGYLKSALRRPTIIEKWSPYEIALFEAALLHHGKEFHLVSQVIGSKSTKEVIDFYYIWKKTEHYKKWKDQFIPDAELVEVDLQGKGAKP